MSDGGVIDTQFIAEIVLDEKIGRHPSADVEHERKVAVFDLVESNKFSPIGAPLGPYRARLKVVENRLILGLIDGKGKPTKPVSISASPFRPLMKDYARVCEAYVDAICAAVPSRIEAIDMGRKGLHDEGAELLRDALREKVKIDEETARRLFTLLYVFQMRG